MDRKKDGTNRIFPELGTFLRSTYFTVGIVDLAVFLRVPSDEVAKEPRKSYD